MVCAGGYTPQARPDFGEFFWDACRVEGDFDTGIHSTASMVAECEWENTGSVTDDFMKLLFARAAVRVMVYLALKKVHPVQY